MLEVGSCLLRLGLVGTGFHMGLDVVMVGVKLGEYSFEPGPEEDHNVWPFWFGSCLLLPLVEVAVLLG